MALVTGVGVFFIIIFSFFLPLHFLSSWFFFTKVGLFGSEASLSRTNRKEAETVYEYSKFPTVPYRTSTGRYFSYYGEKENWAGG